MSRKTTYAPTLPGRIHEYLERVQSGQHPIDLIPSVPAISVEFGVAKKLLYEWAGHHEEMGEVMTRAKEIQERMLNNGGLSGRFNPRVVTLLLGNLGYSSRQVVDHVSSDGSMTPVVTSAEVQAALATIAAKL